MARSILRSLVPVVLALLALACSSDNGSGDVCGDEVQTGAEECDDGNLLPCDGCSSTCTMETGGCGDGSKCPGEECDDGNMEDGDGCSATCTNEPCFQVGIYRGTTSKGEAFEIDVRAGGIAGFYYKTTHDRPTCSNVAGCPDSALICTHLVFDSLLAVDPDTCIFNTFGSTGSCGNCPAAGSCFQVTGTFKSFTTAGIVVDSVENPPDSGCFVSTGSVTWSVAFDPRDLNPNLTSCGAIVTQHVAGGVERTTSILDGRSPSTHR